jgi:1,2-diacylglycerol 3-alpha-glucosyltransferase
MEGKDAREWLRSFKPKRGMVRWGKHAIERLVTLLYQKCDAVIVLSRKSQEQLSSWEGGEKVNFKLIPTGVDPLPQATPEEVAEFRREHGIGKHDKVLLYSGRISPEKNLEILIPTIEKVVTEEPDTKLVFVGDFEYREALEEAWVRKSVARDSIIFAGRLPRDKLGVAYGGADVFVFPSLKDTQGLVLAEAALANLPIVVVDEPVTEVVHDGVNGIVAENSSDSLSASVIEILGNEQLREDMAKQSAIIASKFSEAGQAQKVVELCEKLIASKRGQAQR